MTAAVDAGDAMPCLEGAKVIEPEDDVLDLPILRASAKVGDVVIVGGLTEPESLDALRAATGVALDWVGLNPSGESDVVARLAVRIRQRTLAGLILLDALVGGIDVSPLATAANDTDLAVAFAGTGANGSLRRALIELDLWLSGEERTAR